MQKKTFDVYHTRLQRSTDILSVTQDQFSPLNLNINFDYTSPANYYIPESSIVYGLYIDREFIREFYGNTVKFQLPSVNAISVVEVFAHPHPRFEFIRIEQVPGNKIRIRFTAENAATSDVVARKIYWDQGLGGSPTTLMGQVDARTYVVSGDSLLSATVIPQNSTLDNYTIISFPQANGTYQIKVTSVDAFGNEDSGDIGSVTVDYYPLPPINLTVSVDVSNNVILTWQSNGNIPDNYVIYGNNGSGGTIDRSDLIATISGSLLTYTFNCAVGNWSFVVESKKNGVESVTLGIVSIVVPSSATPPPSPGIGGQITGLSLTTVNPAKVNIQFWWLYGNQATSFNVYSDNGTGVFNMTIPSWNFAVQGSTVQSFTTPTLLSGDVQKTFQFIVRSVNSGIEDGNNDVYSIFLDGYVPDSITNLVIDSVF